MRRTTHFSTTRNGLPMDSTPTQKTSVIDPRNPPCSPITSIDSAFEVEPEGRKLKVGRYRASDVIISIDHEQPGNFPSLWTSTLDGDSLAIVGNPDPSLSLYD